MASPSPTPHAPASVIARRYTIRRKLGSGSMGTVYLAYDEVLLRLVALKLIRTESLIAGEVVRLQDEFRAVASLRHPQIATAFDFGYTAETGIPFYTREYVQGTPLPPGPPRDVTPTQFLQPILDLLGALSYLHSHGILHLDLHAGNLILADDESRGSVLIDVGCLPSPREDRLLLGGGPWPNLPPELVGQGRPSPATDLFLVGRLLDYRLTGRGTGEPRLPREIPGWGTRLTLDLERIAAKALQPSPRLRFASAAELEDAITRALGGPRRKAPLAEPVEAVVGREREIQRIESVLDRAAESRTALLWLSGREGLGKTRLLREAHQRAQIRGLDALALKFLPGSRTDPGLSRTLRAARESEWLEPLEPRHGGSPQERAQRAAEAFFASRGKPLVLVLDSLDLADRESQVLAAAMARVSAQRSAEGTEGRGLALFVSTSNPPADSTAARHGLRLEPLSRAESRELLRSLLQPLCLPREVERIALRAGCGSPRELRSLSLALRERWGPGGVIPSDAKLPAPGPLAPGGLDRSAWTELDARAWTALCVLGRPASVNELAVAARCAVPEIGPTLARFVKLELAVRTGRGAKSRFQASMPEASWEVTRQVSDQEHRELHVRVARHLGSLGRLTDRDQENLARHWIRAGDERATRAALQAAQLLMAARAPDRAVRILEDALAAERDAGSRLDLAEQASSILEGLGDHAKGLEILEPLRSDLTSAGRPGAEWAARTVQLLRRLGVHYHRSGAAEKALAVFDEAIERADAARDVEDLIVIDTELAELQTFRGSYAEAESACRRGLARLTESAESNAFKGRMEVMLRASLGHLELRRLRLPRARAELETALKLSVRFGTTADRAAILHNLAIAENQLNELASARRRFQQAERLLLRAGERRHVVKIATNLAVIAAKLGEPEEALSQLGRASDLIRQFPGQQLEYFVLYSRGIVHHHLGKTEEALRAFEAALPLGRKLGDHHLVQFGEVYAAECHLLAGRYGKAHRQLLATQKSASASDRGLLRRMVLSRLVLVETILGRARQAARARELVAKTPRTGIELLEAWNELFLGAAEILCGAEATHGLAAALETLERLQIPLGAAFARALLCLDQLARGKSGEIDPVWTKGPAATSRHDFLAALEPLLAAWAHFEQGKIDPAEQQLSTASAAIVGSPFLELDWAIELLKARAALRKKEVADARRHLHRSLHIRDHLVELVPPGARKRFLAQPRFAFLGKIASRVDRSSQLDHSTERLRSSESFERMVGQSRPMLALFRLIEGLRDQELPVLISGETGTGKELVARALHRRSARSERPFLALHCAALPPELFESELFGYESGAFTGAEREQPGLLESLEGGSLLLDDVSQLTLECQAKLLRVLETEMVRRLGSATPRRIDVRFLVSTSCDLETAIREGRFRADLYYRLRGIELSIPPLRERTGDILLLARHFLDLHAQRMERPAPALERAAGALLESHSWPGNVRELETVILRAMLESSSGGAIGASHLAPLLKRQGGRTASGDLLERSLDDLRDDLERTYLLRLHEATEGDLVAMSAQLKVGRTKLYKWMRKLGIDVRKLRGAAGGAEENQKG